MVNNLAFLAQLQDQQSAGEQASFPASDTSAPDSAYNLLSRQLDQLNREQKIWLSGFLAGSVSASQSELTAPLAGQTGASGQPEPAATALVTVVYASQTGNGESLAGRLAARLGSHHPVELKSVADLRASQLKQRQLVIFIVSTHGEGDPPDDALGFLDELSGRRLKGIESLKYAVISLGDSSYQYFCKTGRDLDTRLEELGARRWRDTVELDIDYLDHTDALESALFQQFEGEFGRDMAADGVISAGGQVVPMTTARISHDARHPNDAEVLQVQKITGRDSSRDVRHLELAIEDDALSWQPGDSLGVVVKNDPALVTQILDLTGIEAQTQVSLGEETIPVELALSSHLELTLLNPTVLKRYAERVEHDELNRIVALDRQQQQDWFERHQLIDLIEMFPADLSAQSLVNLLIPLTPRLYSIASSPLETPDEVHLTVALKESGSNTVRHGAASHMLTQRIEPGQTLSVYVQENRHFRLPEDPAKDVMMIGPGTGIAPFRAFIQHRSQLAEQGQTVGRHWLLFGNPHFSSDFLYQTELLKAHERGQLTQFDVAFSRDQREKRYVQHLLAENASKVAAWIAAGGHIYICGARRMSESVIETLAGIIRDHSIGDTQDPDRLIRDMKIRKQLQLDVY